MFTSLHALLPILAAVHPPMASLQAAPTAAIVDTGGGRAAAPMNRPWRTITSRDGMLEATLVAEKHPVRLGQRTWSAMLYDGSYLPPVLRIQPGDSVKLHLVNRLPPSQRTNLHYHGTAISPRAPSDDVLRTVSAGRTYDYALYFPRSHDRGLFWYHPHPHGQSEKQVQDGMSGLLVVEGFLETTYPWLTGVPEQLVMLKDPEPPGRPDRLGHLKTMNGATDGTYAIRPGELQFWRIANIGADAYFNLRIDGHRFWLLASDADPLRRPEPVDSLFLPPGARAEVLLEGGAPGRYAIRHVAVNTGPAGDPNPAATLGTLVVGGAPLDRSADVARLQGQPELPEVAQEIEALAAHPITRRRTFDFSETADGNTFFINGTRFAMDSVNTRVRVGDVEEWTLRNTSAEWHAFHIHQLDFLVTEINGVPQPRRSLHDTVNLPFATNGQPSEVKIIVPFTDPAIVGRFVYHCHILEHEDGGMMQVVQVDPASGPPVAATAGHGH